MGLACCSVRGEETTDNPPTSRRGSNEILIAPITNTNESPNSEDVHVNVDNSGGKKEPQATSRDASIEILNPLFINSIVFMNAGDVYYIDNSGSKKEVIPSIAEIVKHQRNEKERFLLKVSSDSYEEIQTVFPTLIEVQDYQKELPKDKTYKPWSNDAQLNNVKQSKSMSFRELLVKIHESKFIGIVGLSGYDKTSLCYRLAQHSGLVYFTMPFMELNYGPDRKLTLRQLLLDNNYPELSEDACESSFKWIVENQDKCLIIMDGYDQANWSLVDNPPVVRYEEPQLVWDLVSSICNKNYLPECHILFTSRPHSMTTVPKSVEPDYVTYVHELSDENMKKLFHAFAGNNADELWKKLHAEAPHLIKLCSTALMLQLLLIACKSFSDFTSISTITRLFKSVFSHLRVSPEYDDILKIDGPLAELAYNATNNGTVVMKPNDLSEVGLTPTIVQDLVIAEHTYTDRSCKVFEGDETLFFIQQSIQEYLTARHVYYALSQPEFEHFVKDNLFTPHWAMVRQFLYGIAFDLSKLEKITERIQTRKDLLEQKLIEKMESQPQFRDLIELCLVVRESADDEVSKMASQRFPTRAWIWEIPLNSRDAHSVALVLKEVNHKLEWVGFYGCQLNSQSFLLIAKAIREMKGSINHLNIAWNDLSSHDVNTICSILHKINVYVDMEKCFSTKSSHRSASTDEENQIQLSLDCINNKNLEIHVDGSKHPLTTNQHE